MICPKNPEHGDMMRNGHKAGKQMWLCQSCGATKIEPKVGVVGGKEEKA